MVLTIETATAANDVQPAWPKIITLPDGAAVLLRPVTLDDSERLRRMFYRLSPQTIQRWFFVAAPSLPHWAERVAALAAVDEKKFFALVALVEDEIIGITRYDLETSGKEDKAENGKADKTAEVSMLIEDAWQSRRLGSALAQHLLVVARERGVTTCMARVLGENRRAAKLAARALHGAETSWGGGEIQLRAKLTADPIENRRE
jgi:L-amino acid N-acyltransferase YncA